MEQLLKNHSLKIQLGTAVAILIALISWTWIGATSLSRINERLEDVESLAERNKAVNVQLQAEATATKVSLAEIKVQLTNIAVGIAELKQDLKEHDN